MATAIYDGFCVICQQSRRIVKALDWFNRVEFLNIHDWDQVSKRYPDLNFEQAMGQMHFITQDGTMIGGFEGVRRLLRELPLGFPIWLLLHIPGAGWLGDRIYKLVANNRYKINRALGAPVCENGACKIHGAA